MTTPIPLGAVSHHPDLQPSTGRWNQLHRQLDERWRRSAGRPAALDTHDLLGRARQQALLEDFGSGSFREGFDLLVASLNDTAELHTFGRWAWRDRIVALLMNRLAVRDWTKKNPLVHHERVIAPLVITGFDENGIDRLASVLQLDPNVRTPAEWEVATVCPPQSIGVPLPPAGASAQTPVRPGSCDRLLGTEFVAPFELDADIETYGDWFLQCDMAAAYELHHHQLKILQSALPTTQWVLHGLAHAWHLPALLQQYPDARIVWVHRDPVAVVADAIGHRAEAVSMTSDRPPEPAFASHWADRIATGLAARPPEPPPSATSAKSSIFDVQAIELSDDPVGMIEMIYRYFGLELGDLGRHRMQAALMAGVLPSGIEARPLGPTQSDALRTQFADYTATYEVPSERPGP